MAGRIIVPDLRAFDSNGASLSGAKLYSYITGTTVDLETFTDPNLTIPHENPVVADAAGRFETIWAPADTPYRIVVTDSTGATTLDDVDPVVALGAGINPPPRNLTEATTLTADDLNRRIGMTGTWPLTLPLGSTLSEGWSTHLVNDGAGIITVDTQGADLIEGASSAQMVPGAMFDVRWTGTQFEYDNVSTSLGRHAIWVPVDAMIGRITNPPGVTVDESATNKQTIRTFDFDPSIIEHAQFRLAMPKSWDEGTYSFAPVWLHGSTTTDFKVSWGLQSVAVSDDDPLDSAFGTAQFSNDTGGTTNDIYRGPESAPITAGGTPAAEDLMLFQVFRKADDGTNDTLAIDARLLGLTLYLNTDAGNDA